MMKSLVLWLAKGYFTPERLKDIARVALDKIAATAKEAGGDTAKMLLDKAEKVTAAMKDGTVDAAETEAILGDVITQENIDWVFKKVG